ncbi:7-deoxyloganetin glucosyltransferase-like [Neltuma alba]|uniref:7-deoxyloganetin glucosyltransferase-like n=1 Tax=Neltuma alba TaxID=207710 RepID=UPI0010A3936C|nr:7-deoxyloganetin glucosyltransferase-like [Prosopis alba]
MGSVARDGPKPHAVLTPLPLQGHINSLFKLAKLLHVRGFFITFVNTEFNHKRLLRSRGVKSLDDGLSDFRFETIPDGLPPPTDDNASQDVSSLCDSTRKNCLLPFQRLLGRLSESASNGLIPPVTCLVSDVVMFFTVDAAEALGLPIVLLWPASACSLLGFAHYQNLLDRGVVPLKDESSLTNGYLEEEINWIPDQQTNCKYACQDWGIGVEIDTNVKREEVEKLVNNLMEGEQGKTMRRKTLQWRKIVEEDTRPGGSSYNNWKSNKRCAYQNEKLSLRKP